MSFVPFTDEELQALEERFGAIHVYTPVPRPLSRWAKPDAKPEPAFSLVFRACVGAEWEQIQKQLNDDKRKAGSPANLAKMAIVAISLDGTKTIASVEQPDMRAAQKPVRDTWDALLKKPGCVGIPEAVADQLAELNGVVSADAEKG